MAFKIVNGKLVKITSQSDFGTPAQKAAGRRFTGTLGLPNLPPTEPPPDTRGRLVTAGSGPSAPITYGQGPVVPTIAPDNQISAGSNVRQAIDRQFLENTGGITGTLGLPQTAGRSAGDIAAGAGTSTLNAVNQLGQSIAAIAAGIPTGVAASIAGRDTNVIGNIAEATSQFKDVLSSRDSALNRLQGGGSEIQFGNPLNLGEQPNIITGTGPSPIQLGNPNQTLGDRNPLFPEGTVIGRAGGTTAAMLPEARDAILAGEEIPEGSIVDLTRVETYGQLAAESLLRFVETGNPDMRPTNIREEWAMTFRHLWENDFDNVSDFLSFYGYRQIPGTNEWLRQNISDPGSPSSGGQLPPVVSQGARGFGTQPAARGRVGGLGLTNWRI